MNAVQEMPSLDMWNVLWFCLMPKFSAIHLYAVWRRSKASHDQTRLSQREAGESESVDLRWKSETGDTLKSCPIQRAGGCGCGVPQGGVVEASMLEVYSRREKPFKASSPSLGPAGCTWCAFL